MALLSEWTGVPPPDVYFLSGPTTAYTAAASLPFTLIYRGYIHKPIAFTCHLVWTAGSAVVFETTCAVG
jgi:hypothetical protein